jgi:hypothetical protein
MSSYLEALISSMARIQVLRLFLFNPDRHFYQREIGREAGQPLRAVQREVDRLAAIDLLVRSAEGNRVFYALNPDFPLLAELTALFQKAAGAEAGGKVVGAQPRHGPEPASIAQPFTWMETPPAPALPPALRRQQTEGEWDRAY